MELEWRRVSRGMDIKVLLRPDVYLWKHKGRVEIHTGVEKKKAIFL